MTRPFFATQKRRRAAAGRVSTREPTAQEGRAPRSRRTPPGRRQTLTGYSCSNLITAPVQPDGRATYRSTLPGPTPAHAKRITRGDGAAAATNTSDPTSRSAPPAAKSLARTNPTVHPRHGHAQDSPSAARACALGDHSGVTYDEDLANRIRELVGGEADLTEKKMFGGLAFLVGGNMAVAASGQGGLMVRVDPGETDALVVKPHAKPFEMRGREMQGWLRVDDEGVRTKRQLEPWVKRGVAYARSLPAK